MELVTIFAKLWRLKYWVVAAACVSLVVAILLRPKSVEFGAASTQVLVDSPKSSLGDLREDLTPLTTRAGVYARFLTSAPIEAEIAQIAGVPATNVTADSPIDPNGAPGAVQPGSERRASQLVAEAKKYRLFLQAEESLPIVAVYAEAPTTREAKRLANAVPLGLQRYVDRLQAQGSIRASHRIQIQQLGRATGGTANQGSGAIVAVLAALTVFVALCLLILFGSRLREAWDEARAQESSASKRTPFPDDDGLIAHDNGFTAHDNGLIAHDNGFTAHDSELIASGPSGQRPEGPARRERQATRGGARRAEPGTGRRAPGE